MKPKGICEAGHKTFAEYRAGYSGGCPGRPDTGMEECIFAGEKSGPIECFFSGGNEKPPYPFPDKAAHQKNEMKNRRTEPLLSFDGTFRPCQTTEMTPAVLIHHRVSLLTCVMRASLSASVSLPSHGGITPRNGGLSSSGMTVLGWTHAHSTVRVGISACFIFGCFLTFMGLCGIAAAR